LLLVFDELEGVAESFNFFTGRLLNLFIRLKVLPNGLVRLWDLVGLMGIHNLVSYHLVKVLDGRIKSLFRIQSLVNFTILFVHRAEVKLLY
jgi:hypothetical protein